MPVAYVRLGAGGDFHCKPDVFRYSREFGNFERFLWSQGIICIWYSVCFSAWHFMGRD